MHFYFTKHNYTKALLFHHKMQFHTFLLILINFHNYTILFYHYHFIMQNIYS